MAEANPTVKAVLNHLLSNGGGVVDSWDDGNGNWYQKFSNGFLIQGWTYSGNPPTNSPISITFPTSFSGKNYVVLAELTASSWLNGGAIHVVQNSKTASGCAVLISTSDNQDRVVGLSCVAAGY